MGRRCRVGPSSWKRPATRCPRAASVQCIKPEEQRRGRARQTCGASAGCSAAAGSCFTVCTHRIPVLHMLCLPFMCLARMKCGDPCRSCPARRLLALSVRPRLSVLLTGRRTDGRLCLACVLLLSAVSE
ncbi:hypothetical protein NDU88_007436 [Pleurodeles waltl]|uniref:Uncharacterized protein n=1 Tax=Pleurodeles waltl TaxID=8319 RepID=A0AAV7PU19_PLEWA|nr:hypothetical protein NDU88_007436 [Pleurodeles waltl]